MAFAPTAEQQNAMDLFSKGETLAIEALAGTGKTSTLELVARGTKRRGQYIALNKAIVVDAKDRFPGTVTCSTAHSLAFRSVGKKYKARLDSRRMKSQQIARELGIDPMYLKLEDRTKVVQPKALAGHVMKAIGRFCQTVDPEPGIQHFDELLGIDAPNSTANSDEVNRAMLPFLRKAWADILRIDGRLPFKHDHYLKIWQLSDPIIWADYIMLDEAQDANPVILDVIKKQRHAQFVAVGDSNQQIYSFTGAKNALAEIPATSRATLTQSFRFGPAVADVANVLLGRMGSELRVVGFDNIASVVSPVAEPDAILCRTNAVAFGEVLRRLAGGQKAHLVGGGVEVIEFAKGAAELMEIGSSDHPDLWCFSSWEEVEAYVSDDAQGGELRLLVKLVNEFGTEPIIRLASCTEADADVIVSTAHKSKGRQWRSVRLAGDFPLLSDGPDDEELRLLYVAVTRAQHELDITCTDIPESPAVAAAGELKEDPERQLVVDFQVDPEPSATPAKDDWTKALKMELLSKRKAR